MKLFSMVLVAMLACISPVSWAVESDDEFEIINHPDATELVSVPLTSPTTSTVNSTTLSTPSPSATSLPLSAATEGTSVPLAPPASPTESTVASPIHFIASPASRTIVDQPFLTHPFWLTTPPRTDMSPNNSPRQSSLSSSISRSHSSITPATKKWSCFSWLTQCIICCRPKKSLTEAERRLS